MKIKEILTKSDLHKEAASKLLYRRDAYDLLKDSINKGLSLIITGLRQIGKTTIMKQLLNEIDGSVYVSIRPGTKKSELDELIRQLIIEYGKKMIFLDEIQRIKGWEDWLIDVYDDYSIPFVVSGSSSLQSTDTNGSVRFFNYRMTPLSFTEYLDFTNKPNIPITFDEYAGANSIMRYTNADELFKGDVFNDYMRKYVYVDMTQYNSNIKPDDINIILNFFKTNTSGEIVKKEIVDDGFGEGSIATKYRLLDKHIQWLVDYSVAKVLHRRNKELSQTKSYKIYMNPHLYLMLNNTSFNELPDEKKGYFIEAYLLFYGYVPDSFYIRQMNNEKYANQEVDFVSKGNWIEVKASTSTKNISKNLSKLFKESNGNHIKSKKIISFVKDEKINGIKNVWFFDLITK